MIKKFISQALIFTFFFSSCSFAQEPSTVDPTEAKIDKAIAEANRNKELLEIWKEHVKTLTQERDDAYRQIESLKTTNSSPMIVGQPARFGEIEIQPLPASMMMPKNIPLQSPSIDNSGLLKDIQGYQGSIKDLRGQLGELQFQNQRMQKEILESGNDKTLIIKDKEEAVAKLDVFSKEMLVLKDENQKLTGLLHSASLKDPVVQQTAQAAPVAVRQDPFEVNYLKSQNGKLKAELEKLRSGAKTKEDTPALLPSVDAVKINQVEAENRSLKLQLSDNDASLEAMKHNFDRLNLENEETKAEYDRLKSDLSSARSISTAANTEAQSAKAASLQQIITSISAEKAILQARSQTLTVQVSSLEKSLKEKATNISGFEESRNMLKMNLEKNAAEKEELLNRNRALMEELNAAKENTKQVAASSESLTQEYRGLKDRLSAATTGLDEKINLEKQIESLKLELEAKTQSVETNAAGFASEKNSLMKEIETLKTDAVKIPQYEAEKKYLQNIYAETSYKVKRNQIALDQAIKKLEASKAQNLKLSAQIQADQSARQVWQTDSDVLKAKLQALFAEKDSMNGQIAQLRGTIDQLQDQNRKTKNDVVLSQERTRAVEAEKAEYFGRIESLRSQITLLEAEKEKINILQAEKEKLSSESDTMKKTMVDLEHEAQVNEDRVGGLNEKILALENTRVEQAKTIEMLNTSLKQSLDDIQNLKNNFQSYLESLVTSFEDRQKKSMPAPAEVTTN